MDNLKEMDRFLARYDLSGLNKEEIENINIPITKKGNAKEWLNYCKIALISHSKVMLKILQARLQ